MNSEASAIGTAITGIITKTTFNGVALLNQTGANNKTHAIGVTDDGATVTLTTGVTLGGVTTAAAAGAEGTADTTLTRVAISLGHIAAGISALKGRQAVAYAASANLAISVTSDLFDTPNPTATGTFEYCFTLSAKILTLSKITFLSPVTPRTEIQYTNPVASILASLIIDSEEFTDNKGI